MMLPENIFPLSNDRDAPGEKDADPFSSVMYFCTRYGWMAAGYDEKDEMIADLKCTFWTYTPELPPQQ
jgi:hypothetical protein